MNELMKKQNFLRELMDSHGLDALLLQRVSSIAWLTGVASTYVSTACSDAEASVNGQTLERPAILVID